MARIGEEWTVSEEIRSHLWVSCASCTGRGARVWISCASRFTAPEAMPPWEWSPWLRVARANYQQQSGEMSHNNRKLLLLLRCRHGEDSWKYNASSGVFLTIFDVFGNTVLSVWYIFLIETKTNFKGKHKIKIVKISANEDQISKHLYGHDLSCLNLMNCEKVWEVIDQKCKWEPRRTALYDLGVSVLKRALD